MTKEEFKRYTEESGYIYIVAGDAVYAVNDERDGVWIAEFNEPKQKLKCCTDWNYPIGLMDFSIDKMYPFEPVELTEISEYNYKKHLNNMTKLKKEIIQAERERKLKEDF